MRNFCVSYNWNWFYGRACFEVNDLNFIKCDVSYWHGPIYFRLPQMYADSYFCDLLCKALINKHDLLNIIKVPVTRKYLLVIIGSPSFQLLWWTWHDTDFNISDRHYWVPWTSYFFHMSFHRFVYTRFS